MANKKRIPMDLCLTFQSMDKLFIGPEEKYDVPFTLGLTEVTIGSVEPEEDGFFPPIETLQNNDVLVSELSKIAEALMKYDPLVLDISALFTNAEDIHGLRKYGFIFLQFLMLNAYKYCISLRLVMNCSIGFVDDDLRYYAKRLYKSIYLLERDFDAPRIEEFVKNVQNSSDETRYLRIDDDDEVDLYEQFQREKVRAQKVQQASLQLDKIHERYKIKHDSQPPLKERNIWSFDLLDETPWEILNIEPYDGDDNAFTAVNIVLDGVIPLRDAIPDEYMNALLTEDKDEVEKYLKHAVMKY